MRHIALVAATAGSVALASSAVASTEWEVQWSSPQAISTSPVLGGTLDNGALAASAAGTSAVAVWAQYQGNSKYQVWTTATGDAGATWASPSALSASGPNAEFPDAVLSDDGTRAAAVWYVSVPAPPPPPTGDYVRSAWSDDGGATWTSTTITGPMSASRTPDIAGSADGSRLVAIWGEFVSPNDVLKSAVSTDGGQTWSTPAGVSDPGASADDPTAELSDSGLTAIAAFTENDGVNDRVLVRTSSDGGATWATPETLSDAGQNARSPQIAVSDDGTRMAVSWIRSDGTNDRVQASFSNDAGTTWSSPVALSGVGQDAASVALDGSADGQKLTVAWQISTTPGYRIQSRSSTDAGTSWTAPVTHSPDTSAADNPDVAVSDDGRTAAITWYRLIDFNPSRAEITTSADSGATWSGTETLSDTGFDANDPLVTVSADGRRLLTSWAGADATETLIRSSTGILRTNPGAPGLPTAIGGDAQLTASWTPPADDGGSTVTGYTATAAPGGQTCTTAGTSCTIGGLTNGTSYTVTVTASNAIGTGPASAASNAVTPLGPPPPPPPPTPTPTPEPEPPSTKVKAKTNDAKSKLKVKIKPDLGKKKQWEFVVKVKKKGDWKTIKTKKGKTKVYETEGSDHKLTIDLDEGKYKAKSKEARGYLADTSDVVKLKK